jgi:uncharacterized FlaG/YvyC family protein
MSFEIGPLTRFHPLAPARAVVAPRAEADAAPVQDTVELSLSATPPEEVLDAIGDAADRVDELWADNRELHFRKDEASGRVIVEVRDRDGHVIRTIPPSQALDVMSGADL